ncbi:hypothetical protein C8E03_1192 [Lachnotalea glycerini]|uniref:Uncharacterized protein n=1 Tax=Lachnotalea glycerini TaxID=1763509 RepID=A0A318EJ36_9FIRM|nr:CD1375 family protein [Lachnotalea glycerini]PXV85078.1 hypothetical protein C8E03_1192 [Lachnotalea glycerini]
MVALYVYMINNGKYTLKQVPVRWYKEVKAIIEPESAIEENK